MKKAGVDQLKGRIVRKTALVIAIAAFPGRKSNIAHSSSFAPSCGRSSATAACDRSRLHKALASIADKSWAGSDYVDAARVARAYFERQRQRQPPPLGRR
jgi:hypothetical protein